ncbi:putative leucine-rich repeat-containing, plant-type, leucine-rich repeat domain superfamily [Helianthus debilis subsp. tardiflorus]
MSTRFTFYCFSCSHLCLLVLFPFFHLCLSKQNSDRVLCMDGERQALLRFKQGLIDKTGRLASWVADDKECCKWIGIACDNTTGHVHGIHLPGLDGHCNWEEFANRKEYDKASKQKLKGDINPSLLDLQQLEYLDLSCNDFGGMQVPKFIGSFQNLRYLNLSNSYFGGHIPSQLGNLSKLHVLSLGNFRYNFDESTSIMNMQWLSSLVMLHHLDLSGVDLSKATDWLHVINTLPSLVQLHLSYCKLSHIHPNVPSLNLTSLSLLDLSLNSFDSSMPPWIFNLTSLLSLDLNRCLLYVPSTHNFRNLTNLEFLNLYGSNFMNSPLVLKELSSSNLISLDIGSCGVSSLDLDSLHNLTNLLSLGLSSNELTNRIPKSLGNLCNLKEIELSFNNFGNISLTYLLESFFECKSSALESLSFSFSGVSGHLPDQLGQLSNLKHILLSENYIIGTIPHSIGQLSFLRTLDLSVNQMCGSIPFSIGRLSLLEVLDLGLNQLNGSLSEWIGGLSSLGQLTKLVNLDISFNLFTGVVTEAHFTNLVSLNSLEGKENNLTLRLQVANWIPSFRLQRFSLSSWVLGPQFPLWLQSQKDLTYLDISNTRISASMPESFVTSFHNLYYLNMSRNHIQGTLTLLGVPSVEVVDLSFNDFHGKLPSLTYGMFPTILDLSSNNFVGSLENLLCSNGVSATRVLNLGNNHLSGFIPECWDEWPSLEFINMQNNNFFGEIPRTLGSISYLQLLSMGGNKITGRLPSSLSNLTKLEILQLSRNELAGSIPTWFGTKLTLLKILNLRANNFDGNIPHELCYLIHIQILDLAHNNLFGNIPRCFNNFSVLSGKETNSKSRFSFSPIYDSWSLIAGESLVMKGRQDTYDTILGLVMLLDLSSNNFSGHIPNEITTLKMLKFFNLSRNQLTGRIPERIGDMKALESFDLSVNKLSGELPMSLSRLNSLSSFNVSYNNLTGKIPIGTQIQTLDESSFFGNKLCGAPLTQADGCVQVEERANVTQDQKEDGGEDWGFIVSVVLGFVTGFWIILGPLIVIRSWRIAYFRIMTKVRNMVFYWYA